MQKSSCSKDESCVGLTSPCEAPVGKRPCKGIPPNRVRWCRRTGGWPADSIVYTDCSFYYTPCKNYEDPDMEGSGWIPFEEGVLFNRVLNSYEYQPYVEGAQYDKGECIIDCGKWRVALVENPTVSPACSDKLPTAQHQWSDKMTMCELIAWIAANNDKYITGLSISGDTITATRKDGTTFPVTVLHPDRIKVTGFTIDGDKVTITQSNGDVFTQTITHPAPMEDIHMDGAVLDCDNQTITYHYTDGSTLVEQHVCGGDAPATTFTETTDDHTGETTLKVNGVTQKFNHDDVTMHPHCGVHSVSPGAGQEFDPVPLTETGKSISAGGANVDVASSTWVLPKAGEWDIWLRTLVQLVNVNNNLGAGEKVKIDIVGPDGNVFGVKYEGDDFIAIPQAQGKREINTKFITRTLPAGTYHLKISGNGAAKVEVTSVMSNFAFHSNTADAN